MLLPRMAQVSCFFKQRRAQPDQHRDGDQQGEERLVQAGKTQRLVEGPAGDRDVIAGGVNGPDQATEALQGGNRVGQAAKIAGGNQREHGRREQRRHLGARQSRDEQADPGGAADVEQRAGGRGQKISLQRHAEEGHRQHRQQQEVEHPQDDVGELLAQQELQARRRRDVEIDDRAQVLSRGPPRASPAWPGSRATAAGSPPAPSPAGS